jgi:hypothetical protein
MNLSWEEKVSIAIERQRVLYMLRRFFDSLVQDSDLHLLRIRRIYALILYTESNQDVTSKDAPQSETGAEVVQP